MFQQLLAMMQQRQIPGKRPVVKGGMQPGMLGNAIQAQPPQQQQQPVSNFRMNEMQPGVLADLMRSARTTKPGQSIGWELLR